MKRFCRFCLKKTDHDKHTDLLGIGDSDGVAARIFFVVVTLGASEAMADRYWECQECGKTTRA